VSLLVRALGARRLGVEGSLAGEQAAALERALLAAEAHLEAGELVLDLGDLELDDGVATALAVRAIRALLARRPLRLVEAPQMLAHTLYKVGGLEDGRLVVESVRADEPTTAN